MMLKLRGSMRRIVNVAGMLLLLLLLFSFSNRIAMFTRLTTQEEIEARKIEELQQTLVYLDGQITYATSEAAVEEWAREEARMAQEGDFPVVPLNPDAVGVEDKGPEQSDEGPLSNFQVWLEWLFYRGP